MQFSPTVSEINMMSELSSNERLHYATSRMCECEETWGLGDEHGWTIQQRDGHELIAIWPYQQLAGDCCTDERQSLSPLSSSLEHFIYTTLTQCHEQKIMIEVMPLPDQAGRLLAAHDLFDLLEGMMESGEYHMEG